MQKLNPNKVHSCLWDSCGCNTKRGGIGWGVFFLALGIYFLAKEFGYIVHDVSAWTIALIALGVYLILRGVFK